MKQNCKKEPTLEALAQAFQESSNELQRQKLANETSSFLLTSLSAHRMIRAMLFKKGKNADRLEDTLQEATILYVMKILPALRNPHAAWGAFKGAVEIIGRRIGASFYDSERSALVSLDAPVSQYGSEESNGLLMEHSAVGGENETESTIIDRMVAEKAKSSIIEALLSAKMNGKNALSWLSKLNENDTAPTIPRPQEVIEPGVSDDAPTASPPFQRVQPNSPETHVLPVIQLLKATAHNTQPRPLETLAPIKGQKRDLANIEQKKIPITPEYKRLVEIRDRTGMAILPFSEALHIGLPRLRSYLNRKSRVHPEVLARAEQWYKAEGMQREKKLKKLQLTPLTKLIDGWKDATKAPSYAALAGILGISIPTMSRWRKPGSKPMHSSHLIDVAEKVERYTQAHSTRKI